MVMTDPIADFLTRIRNANTAYQEIVEMPSSKLKMAMTDILKREGFIKDYEFQQDDKQGVLKLYLKFGPNREKVITGLKRISKPGLRVYAGKHEVPRVLGGLGLAVISTSKGIMTDKQARKERVGGEVLCYVW